MWEHPATQTNLDILRRRGVTIVEPGSGYLACGMIGAGRLAEPEQIVAATLERLGVAQDLAGETVLITAGPTHEPIDPVRYLGNRFSGKMGYALCRSCAAARSEGHLGERTNCTATAFRSGNDFRGDCAANANCGTRSLGASQLHHHGSCGRRLPRQECCAGKDQAQSALDLQLEPNSDILADLGSLRQATGKRSPVLIGFAAETENLLENARSKLAKKQVDAIVANDVARSGIGFNSDRNEVTIVTTNGDTAVPRASKLEVAQKILEAALQIRHQQVSPSSDVNEPCGPLGPHLIIP